MRILLKKVMIMILTATSIQGECDVCHTMNNEACHSETEYSLCIGGKPNEDIIICPNDYVCASGPYVCYPRDEVEPSCKRNKSQCGICNVNKTFACISETTIAFCYGEDKPIKEAGFSYCWGDTVCDINSKDGFCTERKLAQPSCITSDELSTTETPTATDPNCFTAAPPKAESAETPTTTSSTKASTGTSTEPTTILTTMKSTPMATKNTATTESTTTTTELVTSIVPDKRLTTEFVLTTQSTKKSTSTTAPPSTTVPSPPRSPNAVCRDAASTGSYSADDPTCTTFIVCYRAGNTLAGLKKSCRKGQYFPPGATYCSDTKPDTCV